MERQLHARCWRCGASFITCPECVLSVRIDPHTGGMLGHVHDGGRCKRVIPTPEERARSALEPLCDACATGWGARTTIAERHRAHARIEGLFT